MTAFDADSLLLRPALLYSGTWRFCKFAARVLACLDRREELALLTPKPRGCSGMSPSLHVASVGGWCAGMGRSSPVTRAAALRFSLRYV